MSGLGNLRKQSLGKENAGCSEEMDTPSDMGKDMSTDKQEKSEEDTTIRSTNHDEDQTGTITLSNDRRDVDAMIILAGEYGCFQKIVNVMLCFMSTPTCFQLTIIYFLADRPDWKCIDNSSVCSRNGTFSSSDNSRCKLPRNQWTYTVPKDYSVQTQYDIVCDDDWLISLSTTCFFICWLIGAIVMGWVADNYGRKFALFISTIVVLVVTLVTIWMPNFYLFIACRSIIGFFSPGTFPQMFILMSEIVGEKQRPAAGISIFLCSALGGVLLGLKAYLIKNWVYLSVACSVPYMLTFFFYFFIPESIRFLRVKGRMDEANYTLQRIAHWNKKSIPSHITLSTPDPNVIAHRANPIDLFRTRNLAMKTIVQGYAWFACGMTYVGLYLAGEDLDGDLYRDYILMAVGETIGILIIMDLVERIGRKMSVMVSMLLGAIVCISLGFIPKVGYFKIMRLVFGMVGKATLASSFDALHTWSVELYPANIRGEGMGFMQVATRVGTATCPWVAKELKVVNENASFVTMGLVSVIAFFVMFYLPETKGRKIFDTDKELESKVRNTQTVGTNEFTLNDIHHAL